MKNKKILSVILLFSIFSNICLFAEETTPEPYKNEEFPTALRDLRRFEVVSLGALPFVTLDATIGYSCYKYIDHNFDPAYTPDIFSKSSFTTEEQTGLILTSLGISIGIGLTDFIINHLKRVNKKKKDRVRYEDINIYPISEDPDATLIQLPESSEVIEINEEEDVPEVEE